MKLNLACGTDIRQDYINVDIVAHPELPPQIYCQGDAFALDWLCEEGSCDEIMLLFGISLIQEWRLEDVLKHIVSRIKVGGILKLSGHDGVAVCRAIAQRALSLREACIILYGQQRNEFECLRSLFDPTILIGLLASMGMSLVSMRREGLMAYLEFRRA